jgi:hypothetical protein
MFKKLCGTVTGSPFDPGDDDDEASLDDEDIEEDGPDIEATRENM